MARWQDLVTETDEKVEAHPMYVSPCLLRREGFYAEKSIRTKECFADLVTETDEKVEAHVISALRTRFPGHAFIGEESTASGKKASLTDDPTWIIDPVGQSVNRV